MRKPQFQLSFDLGNEAFDTPEKRRSEIARIVADVGLKVLQGATGGTVADVNGNTVGNWGLDPVEESLDVVEFPEDDRSYAERTSAGGSVSSIADGAR